jgi:hypothetical protein
MAKKGLKYLKWGKTLSDDSFDALPIHDPSKTYVIGRMNSATFTPQTASGEIYGDDEIAEQTTEIVGATLATVLTEIDDEAAADLFGETVDSETGEIRSSVSDNPGMGGLCYYGVDQIRGNTVYTAYYYPRVTAVLPTETLNTKGSAITFGTYPVTFNAASSKNGTVRIRKAFTDEAECRAWIDAKLPTNN